MLASWNATGPDEAKQEVAEVDTLETVTAVDAVCKDGTGRWRPVGLVAKPSKRLFLLPPSLTPLRVWYGPPSG